MRYKKDSRSATPYSQSGTGDNNLVVGKNSVFELLKRDPKRIIEILLSNKNPGLIEYLKNIFSGLSAPLPKITAVNEAKLTDMSKGSNHQGIIAVTLPKEKLELNQLLKKMQDNESALLLVLDSIQDPQNFGSILRAAECFGVDAVIFSKNRGTGITSVVSKVSAGASELINICEVSNLANAIEKLKAAGFWIVATHVSETAEELYQFKFPAKTVIIMGAEGPGVQKLLLKEADFNVYIPMLGSIDSLNVGQATAVMLSWVRGGAQASRLP